MFFSVFIIHPHPSQTKKKGKSTLTLYHIIRLLCPAPTDLFLCLLKTRKNEMERIPMITFMLSDNLHKWIKLQFAFLFHSSVLLISMFLPLSFAFHWGHQIQILHQEFRTDHTKQSLNSELHKHETLILLIFHFSLCVQYNPRVQ